MDGVEDEGQRGRQEMMRRRESRELEVEQTGLVEEREIEKRRNPCMFSEMFSWNLRGSSSNSSSVEKRKAILSSLAGKY